MSFASSISVDMFSFSLFLSIFWSFFLFHSPFCVSIYWPNGKFISFSLPLSVSVLSFNGYLLIWFFFPSIFVSFQFAWSNMASTATAKTASKERITTSRRRQWLRALRSTTDPVSWRIDSRHIERGDFQWHFRCHVCLQIAIESTLWWICKRYRCLWFASVYRWNRLSTTIACPNAKSIRR